MATEGPPPRVGVAAVVVNGQGKVLLGKRKGSHGAGSWQFPGGHLEHGEELLDCAVREALEETNLVLQGVKIATQTNDVFVTEGKHYITLFALCTMNDPNAEPKASSLIVLEPEKCEEWVWWDWEKFFSGRESGIIDDAPLFLPMKNVLQQFGSVAELKEKFSTS